MATTRHPQPRRVSKLARIANADRRIMTALMFAMLVGGVVALLLALDGVRAVLASTNWPLATAGLFITVFAYAAIGGRFAALARLAGVDSRGRMMTELGFVSTSVGRVMLGGGTAGNLMRIAILRRHGVGAGATVAASLMHTLFNFVFVLGVFLSGVGLVVATVSAPAALDGILIAAGSVIGVIVGGIALMLFYPPVRQVVVSTVVLVTRRVSGRDLSVHGMHFQTAAGRAAATARARPRTLLFIGLLVAVEASAAMAVLWVTFAALGTPIGPVVLVAGFGIGSAAAMASMLPGGLGVQEGSMAAIFALFGMEFDSAVAGAVLFRLLYFFIPFGVSLLFYRRLLGTTPGLRPPVLGRLVTGRRLAEG